MILVSTYTSAKSWTPKPPLHSAVAAEEWCQAKSSSTSKISDCMSFLPTLSFRWNSLTFVVFFIEYVERYCRTYSLSYELLFILAYIANTLYLFFSTRILFLFPRLRPSGDHSIVNLLWAYCKTNPLIVDTSKGRVCVRLIPVSSYILFLSYTHALFINGYEHSGEICCNHTDGKKATLFDSQLLVEALTRKIKLKILLDVSMYHTSLPRVRNVKFQTLLLGKCILTVLDLQVNPYPHHRGTQRVFSVNYLFGEANIDHHRKYHNIPWNGPKRN